MNFGIQHRLAALIDRTVEFQNLVRKSGDDFAQRAADMGADGQSIDLRHMLIDPHEPMVDIHEAETHRRISIDLLDFVEYRLALGHRGLQFRIRGGLVEPQSHGLDNPAVDVAAHQRDNHGVGREHEAHRDRGAVTFRHITNDQWNDGR